MSGHVTSRLAFSSYCLCTMYPTCSIFIVLVYYFLDCTIFCAFGFVFAYIVARFPCFWICLCVHCTFSVLWTCLCIIHIGLFTCVLFLFLACIISVCSVQYLVLVSAVSVGIKVTPCLSFICAVRFCWPWSFKFVVQCVFFSSVCWLEAGWS